MGNIEKIGKYAVIVAPPGKRKTKKKTRERRHDTHIGFRVSKTAFFGPKLLICNGNFSGNSSGNSERFATNEKGLPVKEGLSLPRERRVRSI
jgi:hypothetical protein